MLRINLLCIYLLLSLSSMSQSTDPEFKKGFVSFLNLTSGLITAPEADIFVGGLHLIPQYTIVEGKMRAGIHGGGVYTAKEMEGLFGINTSFKLKTVGVSEEATLSGNINLMLRHLWGTNDLKLLGFSAHFELFNILGIHIMVDRDYQHDNWWITTGLSYQMIKPKPIPRPYNQ